MMPKFIVLYLWILISLFGQTETHKWGKVKTDYRIPLPNEKEVEIKTDNVSNLLISTAQTVYYKLISEHDGDNCPFYPSCSVFFVEAVEETNFLQGSLMFADRFTRDMNFFKTFNSYPLHKSGKFYDPVYKYAFLSLPAQKQHYTNE